LAAGRLPAAYARRIWTGRLMSVIVAVAIGVWVLAAMLVGLATAGGVVWF
jgi:type IV secretory pathway TrbF-like protein